MRRGLLLLVLVVLLVGCREAGTAWQGTAFAASLNGVDPTVTIAVNKTSVAAIGDQIEATITTLVPASETRTAYGVVTGYNVPAKFRFMYARLPGPPSTSQSNTVTFQTPSGPIDNFAIATWWDVLFGPTMNPTTRIVPFSIGTMTPGQTHVVIAVIEYTG